MTNWYDKYIMPKVTNALCGVRPVMRQRVKIVPLCEGIVLEIGFGSGLNYNFYNHSKITKLYALEPSEEFVKLSKQNVDTKDTEIEYLLTGAEEIPLDDNSVDSVLLCYTLCTIKEPIKALKEMARVLKPSGQLFFCEHGLAPDKSVWKWQNIINPIWKRLGGGCNLNRNIPKLIEEGGYIIDKLETMYLPGIKIATYNFWGVASKASH